MINNEIREKIIKASINLERFGLCELAWKKKDAISMISSILQDKIGILGGDTYVITLNKLEPQYENWSCEENTNENIEDFYLKSKLKALSYIRNYPVSDAKEIIFAIVFTEQYICTELDSKFDF